MAGGHGAMFASPAVSALSVSARLTACFRRHGSDAVLVPLRGRVHISSAAEVLRSSVSCGDGRLARGSTLLR